MQEAIDYNALNWVRQELGASLKRARLHLEAYTADTGQPANLRECAACLHEVRGPLQMVELKGADLLAAEMEEVITDLLQGTVNDVGATLERLLQAFLQLPDYLSQLRSGSRDMPVVLLPVINSLREARGIEVLQEHMVFAPDLSIPLPESVFHIRTAPLGVDVTDMARAARIRFQGGLLEWYRGTDDAVGLRALLEVLEHLQHNAGRETVARLWWVGAALAAALLEGVLEETDEIKRLFGGLDRQIKRLMDSGEEVFADAFTNALLKDLLYQLATAGACPGLVDDVRSHYRLATLLPASGETDSGLTGFSRELLQTASLTARDELELIRERLNAYIRSATQNPNDLFPVADALHALGNTLLMLDMEKQGAVVVEQEQVLRAAALDGGKLADPVLMRLANALVAVEDALVDMGAGNAWSAATGEVAYRQGLEAVIRESLAGITGAKEAINGYFGNPAAPGLLEPVPALLEQVRGGLQLAGEQRAAAATARVEAFITTELLGKRATPGDGELDRLADAICSIEYYIEELAGSPVHGNRVLEVAEASLAGLGVSPEGVSDAGPEEGNQPVKPAPAGKNGQAISELPVIDEAADEEILEIFREEAAGELAGLEERVPAWVADPANMASLETLSRSCHTLKGGARMLGGLALGEFAWAFENLLNRVKDATVQPGGELLELVQQSVPAFGQLLAQVGGDPGAVTADVDALAARAWQLAEPETPINGASDDDALLEIYSGECRIHLAAISEYLDAGPAPRDVTEPLYRALHTIAGISESAGVDSVWVLTNVMDGCISECYETRLPLGSEALALLDESAREIARLIEKLPDKSYDEAALSLLCQRIAELPSETVASAAGVSAPDGANERDMAVPPESPAGAMPTGEADGAMEAPAGGQSPEADPYADADPELLEIFLEEACELVDSGETTLRAWVRDPHNEELIAELKRQLHTLKGGARMVDITAIGDLSHSLETLLTRVTDGHVGLCENLFAVLNESIDQLAFMLERVKARKVPESAAELEATISGLGIADADEAVMDAVDAGTLMEEAVAAPSRTDDSAVSVESAVEDVPEPAESAASIVESAVEDVPEPAESATPVVESAVENVPESVEEQVQPEQPVHREEQPLPAAVEALLERGDETTREGEPAPQHFDRRKGSRVHGDQVRVQAELLDNMVNYAGEISIYRARMEQQVSDYRFNLGELDQTITRLRDQLRLLEIETETHILFRHEQETETRNEEFDPLEMDRYSNLQQLSRSLMESISDLHSIQELMGITTRESEALLLQQSRVSTDLQEGLMHSRMIRFASLAPRLRRIVRQSAKQLGKQADLGLDGADGEMDRTVIDRIIAPLEHLLRNAVAHGIETSQQRGAAGKPETGAITIGFTREGPEIVLRIADDGAGMNIDAIRKRAVEQGLMQEDAELADSDIIQFVLQTGFSTADEVTQIAGRGVGLDVVCSAVKQLGGSLHIDSLPGSGTAFTVRLPYTLALNQALLVRAGAEIFCIPLASVEGVVRANVGELMACFGSGDDLFEYAGNRYRLKHLGSLLDTGGMDAASLQSQVPVLLVRAGDRRVALQVEAVMGSREIVVKPLGAQLSQVDGISGATILGDGSVVMILDVGAVSRMQATVQLPEFAQPQEERRLVIMVVDDSITVRKVTTRLLERNGYKVLTARDGVDAMGQLQEIRPDVMLLDIEMPRMDGFELATHMRNDERLQHVPIIMITSRTGEKHRQRASQIGVNDYLGKPYQENDLLESLHRQLGMMSVGAEA